MLDKAIEVRLLLELALFISDGLLVESQYLHLSKYGLIVVDRLKPLLLHSLELLLIEEYALLHLVSLIDEVVSPE